MTEEFDDVLITDERVVKLESRGEDFLQVLYLLALAFFGPALVG